MAPIALLSVSNKKGLIPFAKALTEEHKFSLISSGGTAKVLQEANIEVKKVSDYTGSPEILGGRVKTLHPKIHGGILADKSNISHQEDLKKESISAIDLVVVNLYPFQETIKDPKVSWDKAIENIDIGGPGMIRASAKNHKNVSVLTNPEQYSIFLKKLEAGELTEEFKRDLALKAFEHTASYDIAISQWLNSKINSTESPWLSDLPIKQTLRYGENPHQKATWFSSPEKGWGGINQIQGKELSTNNLLDLESALSTVREFGYNNELNNEIFQKAAVVIKHTNPCGVAIETSTSSAIERALDADRISAFGGIVALNYKVNSFTASHLTSLFLECVVAPSFDDDAKIILRAKPNLRVLEISSKAINEAGREHIRSILGGVLIQEQDDKVIDPNKWEVASKITPNEQEIKDLIFGWKIVRHVRSNAIAIAINEQSIGIGAGQMNRVGAAKIALEAAGNKSKGAILASDGFLPFDDTVRLAGQYGISSIIQPGGSRRDDDSIKACNELGIKMIFTGKRHFLH